MSRRLRRRSAPSCGFVLAEALVSLTIAALTLALLTGATWGLRQTQVQSGPLQQEATDWLTARRILQAWAASATTDGLRQSATRFSGTPAQMRLIVDDGTSLEGRSMLFMLDIVRDGDLHVLTAARSVDIRDVRLTPSEMQDSRLIVSDQTLSLVYQVRDANGLPDMVWTYAPTPEQGLPAAIAVERGADRMIIARVPATRSAACVTRLGLAGLEERDCLLR